MPEFTGDETEFTGPYGKAWRVELPPDTPNIRETVATWLLEAPFAHPLWHYHYLGAIRLRDVPGLPPPKRYFHGATHELSVFALNPEHQPYNVRKFLRIARNFGLASVILTPSDVSLQFEATDVEVAKLSVASAWAVTQGRLIPDSDGRYSWLPTLTKTLAHVRGEEHAP